MRPPDKNRIFHGVRHIESDEIPFLESDPDILLVNQILGKDFPLRLHAFELPVPDYVELSRRMGNDMIYVADIWRLGRNELTDEQGRIHYVDGTMKTPQSLNDIGYPDLDLTRKRLEELLAAVEGTGFGISCNNRTAPTVVRSAIGYEDYWIALINNPRFVLDFQRIIDEQCLRELEMLLEYDIDMIHLASGVGSKSGSMCSPDMLEEFEYPFLRQQINRVKEAGKIVHFHIDGNVTDLIPDLINMGVDVLHPLEPCGGAQDIYETKQQYGSRITLHGNIDVAGILLKGNPEQVQLDVHQHIDALARGGGYIVGSSHDLHADVPIENFYAMRDAAHSYRRKGRP